MSETRPPFVVIFAAALELPAAQRAAYLEEVCAGDDRLRQRVEALIRSHDEAGTFMESPGVTSQSNAAPGPPIPPEASSTLRLDLAPLAEQPGEVIDRYKLLQQIGEGGCGVVYMAAQEEPIKRRVALKVIKPGMDTRQVLGRFEAERQVLALMDHPNIAKVLDAGATASGRPYFVMELVHGIPATRYCDEHKLTTRQRLELFIKICQAVQHAHQKGIIHRDIKPSNILVADHDGLPVPKVIDFGIAKATAGQELSSKTVFTAFEQFVGTPAYMSPEQANLSGLDIDTRSDIYSLGVLLYELLTGQTPFDAAELYVAGLDEIRRLIREVEPPKPSTRLSTLDAAEETLVAGQRQSDPPKLRGLIRDDLDWIVMKCLEKDRTRRYETANGLAADLQRHLKNEPVVARPPSQMYRFQKMARRNKVTFAVGTTIAVILVLGIAASLWQAGRANREARRALAAEAVAQDRLAESQAISKFMLGVFQSPDPSRDGRTIMVAETLDRAVTNLDHDLAAQPGVRAQLLATLGRTYYGLGLYREAIPLEEHVRDYDLTNYGLEDTNTLGAMYNLANSYDATGRIEEALKLSEEVLTLDQKALGPEHPQTLAAMENLASSYNSAGRKAEALKLYEKVLSLLRAVNGPEHPETLMAIGNLANSYGEAGRTEEALKLREEELTLARKALRPENPETLRAMGNLALSYAAAGRNEEALKLRQEVLTLDRKALGPEHPRTLTAMNDLAVSYDNTGRGDEALKLNEELLMLRRKLLGPEHLDTLMTMMNLALSYKEAGRREEALKLCEEVLPLDRKVFGPEHPYTFMAMNDLANSYDDGGRKDEALKLREELLPLLRKATSPDSDTLSAMNDLAFGLAISDPATSWNGTNAVQLAETAVAATVRKNTDYLDTLAAAYAQTQQYAQAQTVEQEAIGLLNTEADKQDYRSRLLLYQAHQPCRKPKKD